MNLSVPAALVIIRQCDVRDAEQTMSFVNAVQAGTASGFFPSEGPKIANEFLHNLARFCGITNTNGETPFQKLVKVAMAQAAAAQAAAQPTPATNG